MRMLLLLATLFLSDICLASGKVTVRPSYVFDDSRPKYSIGLAVYEKIYGNYFYSGWAGYGEYDALLGQEWFKTRHGVDYLYGPLSIEAGASYQYNPDTQFQESEIYSSLTLTLW